MYLARKKADGSREVNVRSLNKAVKKVSEKGGVVNVNDHLKPEIDWSEVKNWAILIFIMLIIVGSVIYGIWYAFFYWNNCAFKPVAEMPGLCLQSRGQ